MLLTSCDGAGAPITQHGFAKRVCVRRRPRRTWRARDRPYPMLARSMRLHERFEHVVRELANVVRPSRHLQGSNHGSV